MTPLTGVLVMRSLVLFCPPASLNLALSQNNRPKNKSKNSYCFTYAARSYALVIVDNNQYAIDK